MENAGILSEQNYKHHRMYNMSVDGNDSSKEMPLAVVSEGTLSPYRQHK